MPYVYPSANNLPGKPSVGTGECVALVRQYSGAPPAITWKQGTQVWGNKTLKAGTAIATFEHGRWPNKKSGNHAAFYLGQDSTGVYIVDQWNHGDGKEKIKRRKITPKKAYSNGTYHDPSDNALAFSVIE